jgi:uncharacterized UPF0160 family protein
MITKRQFKKIKTVAVHSGSFHSDDVFAIAILKLINSNFEVIRTRDEKVLKNVDMRVDVGSKYFVDTMDFDHHQDSFDLVHNNFNNEIPYAACGLIWKHFGHILIKDEEERRFVEDKLITFIDADDNGIRVYDTKSGVYPYTLQNVIASYKPTFDDRKQDFDRGFFEAVDFAKHILMVEIKRAKSQTKIKNILEKAVKKYEGFGYVFLKKSVPWKNYIIENSDAKYVIYKASNDNYHVQGIPVDKNSFRVRKPFPKKWGGLKNEDFQKMSNIKSGVFCHKGLFLSVTEKKSDAIKLVEFALNN